MSRSEYESKYYRQLCSFYCGFDPNPTQVRKDVDIYGSVVGRIGLAFRDTRIWGGGGHLFLSLSPMLARFPERMSFTGPDGREVSVWEQSTYFIEAVLEI